jgi:LDH2 family malate/lactate/ureidoglycolate dehydrogenase
MVVVCPSGGGTGKERAAYTQWLGHGLSRQCQYSTLAIIITHVNWTQQETRDPHRVLDGGGLMPLGGMEATAGYKGYGLAMMVELMCGMLGGGMYAHHIRKWTSTEHRPADLGQSFIAVDPEAFAPDFLTRLDTFIEEMRQLEPSQCGEPVLVAGDPERAHMQKVKEDGGILYHSNVLQAMETLAEQLNVAKLDKSTKQH